jgi:hypothetical protein
MIPVFGDPKGAPTTVSRYVEADVFNVGPGKTPAWMRVETTAGIFEVAPEYRHLRTTAPAARAQKRTETALSRLEPLEGHAFGLNAARHYRDGIAPFYGPTDRGQGVTAHLPRASYKKRPGDVLRRKNADLCAWLTDAMFGGWLDAWSVDDDGAAFIVRTSPGRPWERYEAGELREIAAA